MPGRILKSYDPGSTCVIGGREYIVLEHLGNGTALIAKKFSTKMRFGDNADYRNSDVRKYCVGEFYRELSDAVGEDHIATHEVDLLANDGTNEGNVVFDKVSVITVDRYKKYRKYLPRYGDWWWTATKFSNEDGYQCSVCYVCSNGVLSWDVCDDSNGVRPFCILDSCLLV